MWELIRANQRKSVILFMGLAICLLVLGYFVGAAFFPPDGGITGLIIATSIWFFMSIISLTSGNSIFLGISHAKEVTHDVHPQLFNIVEEMKIASNLPAMPKIYIIHDHSPNAFATGIGPKKSCVAVTTGLLAILNRDELQGVIAHEMSHIMNRDVQFLTFAGILLGSVTIISEVFLRGMYYTGGGRRFRSSSKGGGQAQAIMIIVAVVVAILAPILARILYFAISRKREYLADASAARLTRYPEGLASALEKLLGGSHRLKVANSITAPMYIDDPFRYKKRALTALTSTHPPIEDRVKILRNMMGGAGFSNYDQAYSKFKGGKAGIIPASGLSSKESVSVRAPHPDSLKKKSRKNTLRDIGDIARAVNGFAFVACVCGMKVKVPPDFKKPKIPCPRCSRHLDIPVGEMAVMGTVLDGVIGSQKSKENVLNKQSGGKQRFVRKTNGWESVKCNCGHLLQVSPMFLGTSMQCNKCGSTIGIESVAK